MYYGTLYVLRLCVCISPSLPLSLSLSFSPSYFYLHKKVERARVRAWVENEQCRTSCVCSDLLCCLRLGSALPGCICFFLVSDSDNKLTVQNRQQRASPAWKLAIWFYAPSPVFGCRPQMFGRRWETQHSALNVMVQLPLWGCQGFSFSFLRPSCASTSWMRGPLGLVTFCPQKNQPLLTPIAGNMHLSVWTSDL